MMRDVVCGMDVDPAEAPAKLDHDGTTYYFCSEECKADFAADPERYVNAAARAAD